jgi:hypothetical protein
MARITLDRLTITGFRAYLREQEVALRQHATPKSLAVFAPNAKGKSSLIDALEFFFSEDGTLERLGQRRSGRQAGREALEHVRAQKEGIAPAVGVAFHSEEGPFNGSRFVTASDEPMPDAAERVRSARKLDFIIRGYQLRHFVDSQEPSDRYKEVSKWFGLSALLQIQNNLRAFRRHIKETIDTNRATTERQRDLSAATNNALRVWDETAVIAWVREHYLKPLDKDLSLAALNEADAGYQTVKEQKEAEERSTGLATLRRVRAVLHTVCERDALQENGTTKDAGAIPALHEAMEMLSLATGIEQEQRAASAKAVFTSLWEAAQPILDDADMPLDECPVCDTPFPQTAKGSREAVAVHLRDELASLQSYRDALNGLEFARQALQRRVQELKTRISTLEATLEEAGFQDELDVVKTYAASLAEWEHGQDIPYAQGVTAVLGELARRLHEEIEQKEEAQGEHTWARALNKIDALIQLKSRFSHIQRSRQETQDSSRQLARTGKVHRGRHARLRAGRHQHAEDARQRDISGR